VYNDQNDRMDDDLYQNMLPEYIRVYLRQKSKDEFKEMIRAKNKASKAAIQHHETGNMSRKNEDNWDNFITLFDKYNKPAIKFYTPIAFKNFIKENKDDPEQEGREKQFTKRQVKDRFLDYLENELRA